MTRQKEDRPQEPGAANNSQLHDSNDTSVITPNDDLPEAPVLHWMRSNSGHTRLAYIRCPYCSKTHQHGWRWDETTPGSRVAHCRRFDIDPTASYRITITAATYEKAA